jgi:hypothetical protein
MAKDFLVLPGSGPDLEIAVKLAETAASVPTNHPDIVWFRLAKGLAEYREGHFSSAAEWMQRVLADAGQAINRDAEASFVLSMAQHQLGQTDQARATLAQGLEILDTKMAKLQDGDLGGNWDDWMFAHALVKEARGLIEHQLATVKE